jgi:hypothetical protein
VDKRARRRTSAARLERFSAKWIRFAVKKCGTKRADSTSVETALASDQAAGPGVRKGFDKQVAIERGGVIA